MCSNRLPRVSLTQARLEGRGECLTMTVLSYMDRMEIPIIRMSNRAEGSLESHMNLSRLNSTRPIIVMVRVGFHIITIIRATSTLVTKNSFDREEAEVDAVDVAQTTTTVVQITSRKSILRPRSRARTAVYPRVVGLIIIIKSSSSVTSSIIKANMLTTTRTTSNIMGNTGTITNRTIIIRDIVISSLTIKAK